MDASIWSKNKKNLYARGGVEQCVFLDKGRRAAHFHTGNVRFWQRVHCCLGQIAFFSYCAFFWHPPQCWTTLRRQHSRNPNISNYGRIDRGVKIARRRRHGDGHRPQKAKMSQLQISAPTGKLSCWSWYFSCKCSSALLNTTAPAQKGFELQNNLYLFLNIQNLLLSLSYDLVSDFCCLSTVKRAFSALRVSHTPDNVPLQNYSSPSGGGG